MVARLEDKLGQHSSDTAQINFDNCRIPAENLIGAEGGGYKIALGALEGGRIGIAAQSVGMARSAFDAALAYSKERESFGTAIFNHQAVGFRLADCATQIEARASSSGTPPRCAMRASPCLKEAAMAKLFRQRDGRARVQRRHPDAGRLWRGERLPWNASTATCACARFTKARATCRRSSSSARWRRSLGGGCWPDGRAASGLQPVGSAALCNCASVTKSSARAWVLSRITGGATPAS